MSKTKIFNVLCLAVIVVSSVTSVNAATDNKVQSVNKNTEFKQNLKNLDTTNPVTKEIKKTGTKTYDLPQVSGSVQMDENTKAIKVKFNGKEFKITDKDTKSLTSELVSGSLIRKNSNGDVASSVEAVDGGIRMVLNIEKTTDKFYTYDFPVEAESGTKYIMVDQGAKLVSSTGAMIVAVAPPWATDSNKRSLKTWYTVENNGATLRQHVDLSGAKFPVLADPTWCGYGIQSVTWKPGKSSSEVRDTLNIVPTWCGRYVMSASDDWAEVYQRFPTALWNAACSVGYCSGNAVNSMFNQFACHYIGASIPYFSYKGDWNVEPWRPNVGYNNYRMLTPASTYIPFVGWGWACNPS